MFFNRGRKNIDIYYISQSYLHLPKNTIPNNSNINILFKQTVRDIILFFLDVAGLDMIREEWKQLCGKAWKVIVNVYKQIDLLKQKRVDTLLEFVIKARIQNAQQKGNLFD